jgi:5'-3' exonuclease
MNRILVIDFKALGHAVKFSLGKGRLAYDEKPTFLIYGFLLKLKFLMSKTRANIVVFALDSEKSLRKEIYADYKSNRQSKPPHVQALDELAFPQFDLLEESVLPKIGYRNLFKVEGYEADDIIGSICKKYKGSQIVVCTSDHDMYQLLTDLVCIFDIKKNKYYTITNFEEEFGMEPKMWKRVKAIGGCSSDTVKGVPIPQPDPTKKQQHVAEKGAINYLKGLTKPTTKAYQAIESREGKDVINRNKRLVILPFRGTPEFEVLPDRLSKSGLIEVCREFGFKSIIRDIKSWTRTLGLRNDCTDVDERKTKRLAKRGLRRKQRR